MRKALISAALAAMAVAGGVLPVVGIAAPPAGHAEAAPAAALPGDGGACAVAAGAWIKPDDGVGGGPVAHARLIEEMAARPVVLLGESHDDAEHHRWQLSTIAALHGRNPDMVLGFEAFPRDVQPVLDRWVRGELDEAAFLDEAGWAEVWGFDPALYLPLFHFARLHNVPMVALNVDRAFVARVGEEGWAAVPPAERLGLGDPAPASDAYRERLAESYARHQGGADTAAPEPHAGAAAEAGGGTGPEPEPEPADVRGTPEFERFVEAQLTWDRAMAEALAAARDGGDDGSGAPLVVGVIGRGHLEHRHGVPHQLDDLGVADAAVLLPHDRRGADGCPSPPEPGLADAVFALPATAAGDAAAPPPRPRLGVRIGPAEGGEAVQVEDVVPGSVAAAAGIEAGDMIVKAAGFPVASPGELVEIVRRQAPGTWLPLEIERGEGAAMELVAKFPTRFDHAEVVR